MRVVQSLSLLIAGLASVLLVSASTWSHGERRISNSGLSRSRPPASKAGPSKRSSWHHGERQISPPNLSGPPHAIDADLEKRQTSGASNGELTVISSDELETFCSEVRNSCNIAIFLEHKTNPDTVPRELWTVPSLCERFVRRRQTLLQHDRDFSDLLPAILLQVVESREWYVQGEQTIS